MLFVAKRKTHNHWKQNVFMLARKRKEKVDVINRLAKPRAGNLLCTKSTTLAAADKCFRNQFCSFLVYKMEWSSNFLQAYQRLRDILSHLYIVRTIFSPETLRDSA